MPLTLSRAKRTVSGMPRQRLGAKRWGLGSPVAARRRLGALDGLWGRLSEQAQQTPWADPGVVDDHTREHTGTHSRLLPVYAAGHVSVGIRAPIDETSLNDARRSFNVRTTAARVIHGCQRTVRGGGLLMRWLFWTAWAGCASGEDPTKEDESPPNTGPQTETPTPPINTDTHCTPIPTPETLRVITYGDEQPLVGVELLVSDADGAEIGVFETDERGEVSVDVPAGGSVSYAEPVYDYFSLKTTYDIADGGTVVFVSYRFLSLTESNGSVYDITATALDSPPTVSQWSFDTRCDGTTSNSPGPLTLDNGDCRGYNTDQLLVVGLDDDGYIVSWGAAMDLPLTESITASVTLSETAVTTTEVTLSGMPVGVDRVSSGMYGVYEDWKPYQRSLSQAPSGDTVSSSHEVPAMDYDNYYTYASAHIGFQASFSRQRSTLGPLEALVFDLSDKPILFADPPDLTDPIHPELHWIATAGPRGQLGIGSTSWAHGDDFVLWSARFDPMARASVRLPDLPASWSDYTDPDEVDNAYITFQDLDFLDNYADALQWNGSYPDAYDVISLSALGGYVEL